MLALLGRYARWLHTRWPAGRVEPLPECDADGRTRVPGVFMCGDLTGVPLLKFALDSGVRAVRAIAAERRSSAAAPPLVILGAGASGVAAALEARRLGLAYELYEASEPFATVVNFPRGKPIFTYPAAMTPAGELQVRGTVKEALLDELRAQSQGIDVRPGRAERIERRDGRLRVIFADGTARDATHVLVAIGRSGDFRRLGVPGETLDKVSNRLHDPADFRARDVLVAGGGDSALEAAIALTAAGARVTLVHRGSEFTRARAENIAEVTRLAHTGKIALRLGTRIHAIHEHDVELITSEGSERVANNALFTLIGREAPLAFFRRSGIRIRGESSVFGRIALAAGLVALAALYDWKSSGFFEGLWGHASWPADMPQRLAGLGGWWTAQVADRATLLGTVAVSMKSRSFWYTLVYTSVIAWFGFERVRRRRTPYVTLQTWSLFLVQAIPLFILPEIVLPWLGYRGAFDHGAGKAIGDALFEPYITAADYAARHWPDWGHPRAYWRAYGFILAWPLNVYNVFTHEPHWTWLAIGFVQTFVLIPLAILRWGKGVYCGWICSCGALAETLGDTQRTKMPHGPGWNRVNFIGQVFLAAAFALLVLRVAAWIAPGSGLGTAFDLLMEGKNSSGRLVNPLSYKWLVDVLFGGVIGVGFYFKYSGRVWCRFACPLAALMHIYARFSRFAIVPERKKCISCNVCTSVCHQGIDVMAFANRGLPMQDPECVRCSACVHSCPTGVLQFGEVGSGGQIVSLDTLLASPVRGRETSGVH